MGGAWKVAYADFVTAMMAFFLLMWILSMSDKETRQGLAGVFRAEAIFSTNQISAVGVSNNPLIQYAGKVVKEEVKINEAERTNIEMMKKLNQFMLQDSFPSGASGLTSDSVGVLLHLAPDLLFAPGTVEFTAEGKKVMDQIVGVLSMFQAYLVVRGHADSSEAGTGGYKSLWDLSAARANAAIRYLIAHNVDPKFLRSVAYGDTRPAVAPDAPDAKKMNSRVEFHFHRPDAMSTVVGY